LFRNKKIIIMIICAENISGQDALPDHIHIAVGPQNSVLFFSHGGDVSVPWLCPAASAADHSDPVAGGRHHRVRTRAAPGWPRDRGTIDKEG
jgi:hypothetical protein